jgi:hypothetical protein
VNLATPVFARDHLSRACQRQTDNNPTSIGLLLLSQSLKLPVDVICSMEESMSSDDCETPNMGRAWKSVGYSIDATDSLGPFYCEAVPDPNDILYEISDNEDEEWLNERRHGTELAATKYMNGIAPVIYSASLKGPFDMNSGWVNPWRSHRSRCESPKPTLFNPVAGPARGVAGSSHLHPLAKVVQNHDADTQGCMQCHLPSPESLKQGPAGSNTPQSQIEGEELVGVEEWRQAVIARRPQANSFWAQTNSQESQQTKKRKATSSSWLKRLPSKRMRVDDAYMDDDRSSAAGDSFSPSTNHPRRLSSQDDDSQDDELSMDIDDTQSSRHEICPRSSQQFIPSQRRGQRQVTSNVEEDSEDELSQPLPVLQTSELRIIVQEKSIMTDSEWLGNVQAEDLRMKVITSDTDSSSPKTRAEILEENPSNGSSVEEGNFEIPDAENKDTDSGAEVIAQIFETRHDQSFSYNMGRTVRDKALELDVAVEDSSPEKGLACEIAFIIAGHLADDTSECLPHPTTNSVVQAEPVLRDEQLETIQASDTSELEIRLRASFAEKNGEAVEDFAVEIDSEPSSEVSEQNRTMELASGSPPDHLSDDQSMEGSTLVEASGVVSQQSRAVRVAQSDQRSTDSLAVRVPNAQRGSETTETNIEHDISTVTAIKEQSQTSPASFSLRSAVKRFYPTGSWGALGKLVSMSQQSRAGGLEQDATATDQDKRAAPVESVTSTDVSMENASDNSVVGNETPDTVFEAETADARCCPAPRSSAGNSEPQMNSPLATIHSYLDGSEHTLTGPFLAQDSAQEPAAVPPSHEQALGQPISQRLPESQATSILPNILLSYPPTPEQESHAGSEKTRRLFATPRNPQEPTSPYLIMDHSTPRLATQLQSPWAGDGIVLHPSQDASTSSPTNESEHGPAQAREDDRPVISETQQSPWESSAKKMRELAQGAFQNFGLALSLPGRPQSELGTAPRLIVRGPEELPVSKASATHRRETTPPPQSHQLMKLSDFNFFSPERQESKRHRNSGILASIKKVRTDRDASPSNASRKPRHRVSFAGLPDDANGSGIGINRTNRSEQSTGNNRQNRNIGTLSKKLDLRSSPPPETPVAELPTKEDEKFSKHFAAVASRTSGLRQRLLPTGSQHSPSIDAMANAFVVADEVQKQSWRVNKPINSVYDMTASGDEGDDADDVLNNLEEYLGTPWDISKALNEERTVLRA